MVTFEENINKSEINLHGLTSKNEVMKSVKFNDSTGAKVNFDVVIRVKQCHKKDEMETVTIQEVKPGLILMPFDQYEAQENKNNPQPVAKPAPKKP